MRVARLGVAMVALAVAGCGGSEKLQRIDLESAPDRVAVGSGSVWVASTGQGLERLDAEGKKQDDVDLDASPEGLAIGEGAVWWASALNDSVFKVDARTMRQVGRPVKVGDLSGGDDVPIVAAAGGVWVAVEDSVVRIAPSTGRVTGEPIQVGGLADGMAFAGGRIWVLVGIGTKRVPSKSLRIGASIVPEGQEATSDRSRDDTLVAIEPRTGRVVGPRVKLSGSADLGAGREGMWVAAGSAVQRLSPSTGRPNGKPIDVGASLNSVAVGEGAVW